MTAGGGDCLTGLMVFLMEISTAFAFTCKWTLCHAPPLSQSFFSLFWSAQSGRVSVSGTALKRFEEVFTAEHVQFEE